MSVTTNFNNQNLTGIGSIVGPLNLAGKIALGANPSSATETFTVSGNTSFVGNVTQVTDLSSNLYTNSRRVPAGSLAVSNYVTGSVPLTTTTNLIQNYLSNAATISTSGVGGYGPALFCPNSTNSYLALPGNSAFVGSNIQVSNLFVEAWVYYPNVTATQAITNFSYTGVERSGMYITGGVLAGFIYNNSGGAVQAGQVAITASTWTHVAMFYRANGASSTITIYKSGTAGTASSGITPYYVPSDPMNFAIGGDLYSAGYAQANNAYIYDCRVYSGGIVSLSGLSGVPATPAVFGTTQPAYVTGTPSLRMSLQSQYFPGASTSPYGPCLTLPGTVGSYYTETGTFLNTSLSSGFTIEAWVNYASLANSNIYFNSVISLPCMLLKGLPTSQNSDWFFGPLTTGQVALNYYNGSVNYGMITSGTITTGSWTHLLCQGNTAGYVNMYINGVQQTLTAQNTAGSGTALQFNGTVNTGQYSGVTIGQYNNNPNPNFALAKARVLFGANTYTTTSFTPSPNLGPIPAGATVAWQLESQFPLPTYPSIQDVTELPQQASSYGSLPTPVGGVTSNTLSPYTGTQLQSLRFDGTGYIDYGNAAGSVMTTNLWANAWTMEAWIYPTGSYAGYPTIFGRNTPQGTSDFALVIDANGILKFSYGSSGNGYYGYYPAYNTWTHIALVYDGTNVSTYAAGSRQGTPQAAVPSSMTFNPAASFQVGNDNYSHIYIGNLADVRVSNVARYTGSSYTVPSAPFTNDANTLLLLKSLAQQPGTTLEVQGRGLNSVSLGAGRITNAYPPAPMSSYLLDTTSNSSVTYGQGKYVASASSEYSGQPAWVAFDGNGATAWGSSVIYTGGVYNGTVTTVDTLGNAYAGEWIQIQMPVSMILSSYSLVNINNSYQPILSWMLGSRDGVNWTLVFKYAGPQSGASSSYTVSATQGYNYYRLVMGALVSANATNIYTYVLNGTEEGICVTNDSKVGVGIANPQRSLEVAGDLVVGGTISGGAGMGSFRNRIINGDMRIAQRGATAYIAPATGGSAIYGSLDRWFTWTRVAGLISVQQSSTVPLGLGFTYSWLITSLSGYTVISGDYHGIGQYIEGYNIADLNWGTSYGSPITLSFWVRSSTAGNYSFSLEGAGFAPSYAVQYTINNPNTWQQIVLTIPPPPNGYTANFSNANGVGVRLWWDIGSSDASYAVTTPGVWQVADKIRVAGSTNFISTNGATMYLTGVQLEKGTVATPFEFRNYAQELQLCQRYYQEVPFGGSHFTGTGRCLLSVASTNNAMCGTGIYFQAPMRANPAPTYYGAGTSPGNFTVYAGSSGTQTAFTQSSSNVTTAQLSTTTMATNISTTAVTASGGSSVWFDLGWTSTYLGITLNAEI